MSGLAFMDNWPCGETWSMLDAYRGWPTCGFFIEGEHIEEFDGHELGERVARMLEEENPPYPGWLP